MDFSNFLLATDFSFQISMIYLKCQKLEREHDTESSTK